MITSTLLAAVLALQIAAAPSAVSSASPTDDRACCAVPGGTPITIALDATLNSKTARVGETFPIHVVAPLAIDGRTLIAAGTPGHGEVVHAAKSRGSGKAGELILAARTIDVGGTAVALRGMRISRSGPITTTYIWTGYGLITSESGHELTIPAGTVAEARVSQAIVLPPLAREAMQ